MQKGCDSMSDMCFFYDSLNERQKLLIDNEIKSEIKKEVLINKSFSVSLCQFQSLVDRIVIHGKQINKIVGKDERYFNLKVSIATKRAYSILFDIDTKKPCYNLIKEYIELCEMHLCEPSTDILFSGEALVCVTLSSPAQARKVSLFDKFYIRNNIEKFKRLIEELYGQMG